MVKTIIRNIIFNAVKFTSEGKITIESYSQDNQVYIQVEDTGVGINEDDLKKILNQDEYFTTYGTKREKGSGLGLNLCIDFIKRNNGDIQIESQKGEGTKVVFSLPKTKN
jgi:two-component system sensor histidine kinase/response regulator